jgi:hypothetical protein
LIFKEYQMAVIDDLVASGFSTPQAQTVVNFNIGTATTTDLVVAGFSSTQATDIAALNAGSITSNQLVVDGLWFGTQVPAIVAALGVNTAPVANAGPAQTVVSPILVTLTGAGSYDPNGDTLTYAWTLTSIPAGSTAVLAGSTTVSPTFTADLAGAYVASLVVNDGVVSSAPSTVTVTAS